MSTRLMSVRLLLVPLLLLLAACAGTGTGKKRSPAEREAAIAQVELGTPYPATASYSDCAITTDPGGRVQTIHRFEQIDRPLRALLAQNQKVLLVLDIDDTLLTSSTFFGSDRWYEWQTTLPADDPDKLLCTFDFVALNYEAGTQRVVETDFDVPRYLQSLPVAQVLLTARGADYRGATLRELRVNGYARPAPLVPGLLGSRHPSSHGLDRPQRAVSHTDGVIMSTGHNKGEVLVRYLKELKLDHDLSFDIVLLVDDGIKNIRNMEVALAAAGVAYQGFHYTAVPKYDAQCRLQVDPEEIKQARKGVRAWHRLLGKVFEVRGERLQTATQKSDCGY